MLREMSNGSQYSCVRTLQHPSRRISALLGITSTVDDKNMDYLCPICFELISEAHITKCGHTFCYQCIVKCIETSRRCPKCCYVLPSQEAIFPNFLLNELVSKEKLKLATREQLLSASGQGLSMDADKLKDLIERDSHSLTLPDVDVMLDILKSRRQYLEMETAISQNRLLLDFLRQLYRQKEELRNRIDREIRVIGRDVAEVECALRESQTQQRQNKRTLREADELAGDKIDRGVQDDDDDDEERDADGSREMETAEADSDNEDDNVDDGDADDVQEAAQGRRSRTGDRRKVRRKNSTKQKVPELTTTTTTWQQNLDKSTGFNTNDLKFGESTDSLALRKRRMYSHFEDFVTCYFQARSHDLYLNEAVPPSEVSGTVLGADPKASGDATAERVEKPARRMSVASRQGLEVFRENLVKFSRYSSCKTLATLGYSSDLSSGSIVSSIEFDKDNEFFAIAGVTKRIKIYDYLAVIRDVVDIHYPVGEMISYSKISCVAWNSYHKNVLASSDYDGTVTIWDAATGQKTKFFQEHDKRCWSVDFNSVDSRLLASGSDDGRMKLWSLSSNHSVATLETKANICCVKFNPRSSCHIAFGSADHCVHYYDLRNTKQPLCLFTGHQKAVSYVKFLNESEIVSASTDSHLRLWDVNAPPNSKRSYVGHMNEKNFVGLATDGDYIACGSEDISLYVYYKGLSQPLFNLKIDKVSNAGTAGGSLATINPQSGATDSNAADLNEFVSAVCYRKNCNVMVAANSRGIVKVLELV